MAHINTLGAGIYSDLSIHVPTADLSLPSPMTSATNLATLFTTPIAQTTAYAATPGANTFVSIKNVREFPSIGAPANIVNVASYGSKASKQINGQSDAPTIELTINYLPSEWSADTSGVNSSYLGPRLGDGKVYCFRFTLLNTAATGTLASSAAGYGSGVQNSEWYWYGKLEALLINPQLTDANTATLTISVQTDFAGPYTV